MLTKDFLIDSPKMTSQAELKRIEDGRNYVRSSQNCSQVWVSMIVTEDSKLKLTHKGKEYEEIFQHLGDHDMVFIYAKIITGDEVSRRDKFVLITWVGPGVSAVKKGKMLLPRAEIDRIFEQRAKVIEATDLAELDYDKVTDILVKAGGADYGKSTS